MTLLCTGACAGAVLPDQLEICLLSPLTDTGVSFAFIACDYQFTDITDPVEWLAAIGTNDIVIMPKGFWSKALPAQTAFDVSCGEVFNSQLGDDFDYKGYKIDAATSTDQAFLKTIRNGYRQYRVIPITCNGFFYLDDAYLTAITVAGQSPGFKFSWITPPNYVINAGNNQLLEYDMALRIAGSDILSRRLLDDVWAAIEPLI